MRILIIDDSKHFRVLIHHIINSAWPHATLTEYDPLAKKLPNADFNWNHYDILLLDYNLGMDISGLEWYKQQQKLPITIMLTGESNDMLAIDAIEAGIEDYLAKASLNKIDLLNALSKAYEAYFNDVDNTKNTLNLASAIHEKRLHNYYQPLSTFDNLSTEYFEVIPKLSLDGEILERKTFLPKARLGRQLTILDRWLVKDNLSLNLNLRLNQKRSCCFILELGDSLFDEAFPSWYERLLNHARRSAASKSLCLAINAEVFRLKHNLAEPVMQKLKTMGVSFALLGYQESKRNLYALESGLFSFAKITERAISNNQKLLPMLKTLHQHNVKVIAPGINTANLMASVGTAGCDFFQGDYIGKPTKTLGKSQVELESIEISDYIKPF